MKRKHIFFTLYFVLMSSNVAAQVYINGQLYEGVALYQLQQQYGGQIPSGNYWLLQDGKWGYVGSNQVQGNFYTDNRGGGYVDIYPGSGSVMKDGKSGCTYWDLGGYSYNSCDGF